MARPRPVGNLPAELTSFVDRRSELTKVRQLLSEARLVTLTGVAGVGKTRLALRVAAQVGQSLPGRAWLVELAQTHDDALVPAIVVQSLGIRDATGKEPLPLLVEFLRRRPLLLVLDNCEHLVDACARLTSTLLRDAESLLILATSRAALRVPGERVFLVEPLRLPATVDGSAWQQPNRSIAAQYAAVALFAERAAAVVPTFALTVENQAVVANICRRLDGLPLAIELAAVRLRALSAAQILSRLDDRFDVLAPGMRAGSGRQRTLRAALDWSYDLCTDAERAVWARLSVFAGGFEVEAAETVCADADLDLGVADVLDGLVGKSILIRGEQRGRARFMLLETLRTYGLDKLRASHIEAATRRRHAEYYRRLAEQGERDWFGADETAWIARMHDEHANLRSALDFLLTGADRGRTGRRLAATLWFYWADSPAISEGQHWLDRTLELDPRPTPDRAKALWVAAYLAAMRYQLETATRLVDEAEEVATDVGDRSALAWAACWRSVAALRGGDFDRAGAAGEVALSRFQACGEPDGAGSVVARLVLASVRLLHGDLDAAVRINEECLAVCRARGERAMHAVALLGLARVAWMRGQLDTATRHARTALRLRRSLPQPTTLSHAVEVLAWIAADIDDYERVAVLVGGLDHLRQTFGVDLARGANFVVPHERCTTRSRAALGDAAYDAAFLRGAALSVDEIIGYALGERVRRKADQPDGTEAPPAALTVRERQVARLVAEGLSNKEIAARLVISQRTAESHIAHLLHKLNFTSRTQVAVWTDQAPPPAGTG